MHLTTDTVSGFATYGLSDRLDLGVAVPINHVNVKATIVSKIGNTITGIGNPTRPGDEFACETYWIQWIQAAADLALYSPPVRPDACGLKSEASGSATGIGDIVVRTKYSLLQGHGGGLAAGADLRLPTGDEDNLLGIAGAQAKLFVIASTGFGRVSPHMNLGYTVSGATDAADTASSAAIAPLIAPPDEMNYAAGADVAVFLHTTIAFDVVGRTLRGIGTLREEADVVWTGLERGQSATPGAQPCPKRRPPPAARVDRHQVRIQSPTC